MLEYVVIIGLVSLLTLSTLATRAGSFGYEIEYPDILSDSGSILHSVESVDAPAQHILSNLPTTSETEVFALPTCQATQDLYDRMMEDISFNDRDFGYLQTPPRLEAWFRQTFALSEYKPLGQFDAMSNGKINLVTHISSSPIVSVYFGTRPSDRKLYVVKHLTNCYALPGKDLTSYVDPLTHEFVLSRAVSEQLPSLLPAMLWMSQSAPLTRENADKLRFRGRDIDKCVKSHGRIRTIIQARAGIHVDKVIKHTVQNLKLDEYGEIEPFAMVKFFQTSVTIGRKSLELLRELHSIGVIHGDVHSKNIVFTDPKMNIDFPDVHAMQLIDMGQAGIICGPQSNFAHLRTPSYMTELMLAPWQFDSMSLRGFRDDVFRTLEMLANFVSFGATKKYLKANPLNLLAEIKSQMPYFDKNEYYDCFGVAELAGVDERTLRVLSTTLTQILDYVRRIPTFDTQVDYDFIFARFDEAEAVLQPPNRSWFRKYQV